MIRILLVVFAAATLAGCATTPNPLSADLRGGMFIQNVDVGWSAQETARKTNDKNEANKHDMQARLQSTVATAFKDSPSGAQAVTFKIEITRYYPGSTIKADVSVVRPSDGQVLGVYKDVTGMHAQSGGLLGAIVEVAMKLDYVGILSNSFAANLRARFNGA